MNEPSHYTTDLRPNSQAAVATYVLGELITTDWRQTGVTPETASRTEDWDLVRMALNQPEAQAGEGLNID